MACLIGFFDMKKSNYEVSITVHIQVAVQGAESEEDAIDRAMWECSFDGQLVESKACEVPESDMAFDNWSRTCDIRSYDE